VFLAPRAERLPLRSSKPSVPSSVLTPIPSKYFDLPLSISGKALVVANMVLGCFSCIPLPLLTSRFFVFSYTPLARESCEGLLYDFFLHFFLVLTQTAEASSSLSPPPKNILPGPGLRISY